MGFVKSIATCVSKYANFSGRAGRAEYWYWILFQVLVSIAVVSIDGALSGATGTFSAVVFLGLFLPTLAVTVRRLHDIDTSGWLVLISLVPIIGSIILLIMTCSRGTEGPNHFGPEFA
jgi:uncharacterized membrane protein YhaH (DUF805 family)